MPSSLPEFTAQTSEQARLLLLPRYQAVLGATMQAEAVSAGEIAGHTGTPLKQVHHCLTRLQEHGLVAVVAERKRGGRAIKLYQAVAAEYRVPLQLTDGVDILDLFERLFRPFVSGFMEGAAQVQRGHAEEVVLQCDQFGNLGANYGTYKGVIPAGAYGTFGQHKLTPQTRQELEHRLRALKTWVQEQAHTEENEPDAEDCLLGLLYTRGGLE